MSGILGKKIGMTHVFSEDGSAIPVTVIQAGPCRVMQKKSLETDGYDSIQIGFDEVKEVRAVKARIGHCKKAGSPPLRHMREVQTADNAAVEVGQEMTVSMFKPGDLVIVTGTSKGKGFAGGVKRHGYRGGAGSHGSMFHRAVGSIGASSYPSRVAKGKHMPGHMGCDRTTVRNLTVVRVDTQRNLLLLKGAVPGGKRGVLLIRSLITGKSTS